MNRTKTGGLFHNTPAVEKENADPYEMDRRYWDSFIYQPARD